MDRCDREFSVFVSNMLDTIGYSSEMVKHRRQMLAQTLGKLTQVDCNSNLKGVLVGSKGEGNSRVNESDADIMAVIEDFICTEDAFQVAAVDPNAIVAQLDMRHTAPGYARLSPVTEDDDQDFLVSSEGIMHLPNTLFLRVLLEYPMFRYDCTRQGPAMSLIAIDGSPVDCVLAPRCQCPSILNNWLTRRRRWIWPTEQQLQEISILDAHVVAVGHKRSYEQELEWRICFTLAELALVRSFNDTQAKLYILLKFMAKTVLKPLCEGMTSYVMKNVVLWVTELTHPSLFTPGLLVDRLVHCLKVLSMAVDRDCLPSYMIPDRNLLSGTMRSAERKKLLPVLRNMIREGGGMLLRCEKLKLALMKLYKTPEVARAYGERLDAFERTTLLISLVIGEPITDDIVDRYSRRQQLIQEYVQHIATSLSEVYFELALQLIAILLPDMNRLLELEENVLIVFVRRYVQMYSELSNSSNPLI